MKPRVFISLATSNLGGPGKGLLQFLNNGGLKFSYPVLVYYKNYLRPESEYVRIMRSTGVKMFGLLQVKRIDFDLVNQAEAVVRSEGCQILQSHGYKSHILCALLQRRVHLPWVAFVHGWTSENIRMKFYRVLEMACVSMATRVVPVSQALVAQLPALARQKITVIPNSVDPDEVDVPMKRNVRSEYGLSDHEFVIGVVGRLSPEKGQVYFLRSLAQVRCVYPNVVGLLVGDGQDRVKLEAESSKLGLKNAVFFVGYTPYVGDFYRAMDILVIPSLSEGMPNVALEAMLFGKAVVATHVGGVPEVVSNGVSGFIVEPRNPVAMTEAICSLLCDSDLLQRFGQAGRKKILEDFSPAKRTKRIVDMYYDLLQKTPKKNEP